MRWLIVVFTLLSFVSCARTRLSYGSLPKDVTCVAVLPFEVRYDQNNSSEILSELIALEIYQKGARGFLGPMEVKNLFKEANDPIPPVIDPYWAKELGKKLGVDAVLFGSFSQIPLVSPPSQSEDMLLGVDVFLLNVKDGTVGWVYSVKEDVTSEKLVNALSDHAYFIVDSLMRNNPSKFLGAPAKCWHAPPHISREVVATPKPTPTPKPTLSSSQKEMLNTLVQSGLTLPSSIFQSRTTRLSKEGIVKLKDLSGVLKHPDGPRKIQISGHVDPGQNEKEDLDLSKKRAETIQKYLTDHGVEAVRLEAIGHGSSQPFVPNLNQRSRLLNQRVEIKVVGSSKP